MVFADDKNSDEQKQKIQILKNYKKDLRDRKVLVYQILPTLFNFNFEEKWYVSSKYYQKFNSDKNKFKIILIGLDGRIKLEQTEILSAEKILTLIDRMPMRKKEIRNNRK